MYPELPYLSDNFQVHNLARRMKIAVPGTDVWEVWMILICTFLKVDQAYG